MDDVKVLFILGKGRTGSTLVDNLLGSVDGFFTAGELVHLWDQGLLEGRRCGCGDPVADCPVWTAVLEALEAGSPADVAELKRWAVSWPRMPGLLATSLARGQPRGRMGRWGELMGRLYRTIADVSGARVVVDASKIPVNPAALGLVPGVRPYVVQLIRDPRAVAYSWQRPKARRDWEPGMELPRFGAAYSALSWSVRFATLEVARAVAPHPRWLRVRYEDVVRRPQEELRRITVFADEAGSPLPFTGERRARLRSLHTVAGNPDRMGREELEIAEDERWREGFPRRDARVVTALTLPLLYRYEYPVRSKPSTAATGGPPGALPRTSDEDR